MTAADSGRPRRGPIPHTAVVYFHGIGTPRRHEEISRLLDALDQLAQQQDYHSIGRLRGQEVRFEPSRTGSDDEVPFVAVRRVTLAS